MRRDCGTAAVQLRLRPAIQPKRLRHQKTALPAAGNRNGSDVNDAGTNGNYWSSTPNDENNAYNVNFNDNDLNTDNNDNRNNGQSVRLVQGLTN